MRCPPALSDPALMGRISLILDSYTRLIGSPLVGSSSDPRAALWNAPLAVVAHGTEDDPRFFFANGMALERFEALPEQFIGMPSRLSAESPERTERAALLEQVSRQGFITDYSGVRITLTGKRFRIEQAAVWNLIDAEGVVHGQAAAFSRWTDL